MQSQNRILWAVDAFSEDTKLSMRLAQELKVWAKDSNVTIEPVTILSPEQMGISTDFFLRQIETLEKNAVEKINAIVKKAKITKTLPPKILFSNSYSLRNAVKALLFYAKESGANTIALCTQSRKGVGHFFFGSFAETLILQSEIPIYLISPKTSSGTKGKTILFATDLSVESERAFKNLLRVAKERKMTITLFNRVEYTSQYAMSAFDTMVYADYLDEDLDNRKTKLSALVRMAKDYGVKATSLLDEKSKKTVYEAVIAAAKKTKAGMIVMVAQTGPFEAALLGSNTRHVLRLATCPVWVMHLEKKAEGLSAKDKSQTKLNRVVNL